MKSASDPVLPVPDCIERHHIEKAILLLHREGFPSRKKSDRHCLDTRIGHLPPKQVIRRAYQVATGEPLTSRFKGGKPTNSFLENRGFQVVPCTCGGLPGAGASKPEQPAASLKRSFEADRQPQFESPEQPVSRALRESRPRTTGSRLDDLKRFYFLLDTLERRLNGWRHLSACSGRMQWPERGVYFFGEPGEFRTETGEGPRITRIGTHALKLHSKTTLWKRLRQHRGIRRSGGGNHRGSVFRRLVGAALIERDGLDYPSWEEHRGSASHEIRKREMPLERAVSAVIGGMPFLWLAIEDEPGPESLRGYIERHAIALLSNYGKQPLDPPSRSWLGRHCDREPVRSSGLWNNNHTRDEYDPAFLDALAQLVNSMKVHE